MQTKHRFLKWLILQADYGHWCKLTMRWGSASAWTTRQRSLSSGVGLRQLHILRWLIETIWGNQLSKTMRSRRISKRAWFLCHAGGFVAGGPGAVPCLGATVLGPRRGLLSISFQAVTSVAGTFGIFLGVLWREHEISWSRACLRGGRSASQFGSVCKSMVSIRIPEGV